MRIGIDARELCGRSTGVGRYLAGLLHEWAANESTRAHEFVLYASGPIALSLDSRRFPTRTIPGSGGWWWEQALVPRAIAADHLDVWFAPAYTAPLRIAAPTVVAIHDLSFVAHPEWFRLREGARRRWLTRQSAARAASVITISEFSKRELIERIHVPAHRIHVIPPGVGARRRGPGAGYREPGAGRRAEASDSATDTPSLVTRGHRVLFVGSIFNRRHVIDLVRAFAPIARLHPEASLDIVGDNRSYPHEDLRRAIAAEGVDAQVRWHEYVTDERLAALYAGARAFAFLSEYEGLGLTPLEALDAGVPVLLLDTPVARESCGDAALYVAVHDRPATTQALESLLFDDTVRARILAAAPAELAKFDWRRAARQTMGVLESAGRQVL
jgi:glycosyltransferase involved in cell wall biosynthesis